MLTKTKISGNSIAIVTLRNNWAKLFELSNGFSLVFYRFRL
jgi:hypothetical protein